ncbi:MAG: putative 2-aminoethylphosphonate ABC transporter permease subunit [Chitinispirillia bacterium]|nr:putative 2-aminoethylphosphonate ABC transporter permease subunit [Chitinispirillia bacterium]MCL2269068.1 putative 2-aminoethylphosphonate ABC transporter permease subunit [Chitinispirillia bacterium]
MTRYSLRRRLVRFSAAHFGVLFFVLAAFTVVFILPLLSLFSQAFTNDAGVWAGLANYKRYFSSPALSVSVWNTVHISLLTTLFSTTLGFFYAYAVTRTAIPGKKIFTYAALLPIFIPTVVQALGLVYIFGRQGIITQLGFDISLYGRNGIVIAETIYTFPSAFLLFYTAFQFVDGRLYEVCNVMGVKPLKCFFHVTLPEMKYAIVNAVFVCFTLAFTDFGAPKVIGGNYNVLATDVYKQVAGQFNMSMGAVVGTLLLIPAVLSFIVGRFISTHNSGAMSAKTTALTIKENRLRDMLYFILCAAVSASFLFLVAALCVGAFTAFYPYDMSFTLKYFTFTESRGGLQAFFNSISMSALTAFFGTVFVFLAAYMIEKTDGYGLLTKYGKLLSLLPLAVPGMVIGISYIFFFNSPANPLNFIYGTVAILVLSNIVHYFSVPYLTAAGAFKKLDKEFEIVAESMKIPRWQTFFRVSIPLSANAVAEVAMYLFVNSMVTVSALVFLFSADFKIAAVAITHMEEAGENSQAAAMSILIIIVNIIVRALYELVIKFNKHKQSARESM